MSLLNASVFLSDQKNFTLLSLVILGLKIATSSLELGKNLLILLIEPIKERSFLKVLGGFRLRIFCLGVHRFHSRFTNRVT